MNSFKQQHLEKKNEVITCLKSAEKFFTERNYLHEAEVIAQQRINVENGEFSIAVVGEFSAGKSTFLNALMGEKILPSFTNETTATINFLRHKEKAEHGECGKVFYNDGHSEDIPNVDLDTISEYVSARSTTVDVAKTISHLDLYLDSRFLEGNVTLVDTPGLNGIAEGHKEITQEQIEKSSAGIFLFDANKPGSKSDFEFLTELRRRVKSIIFVLNKIDNIRSSEGETVETVIKKLKENYKKIYPDAETVPEIWPVAAYPALVARGKEKMDYQGKMEFSPEEKAKFEKDSRMQAFEDRLWRFLTQGEKAKSELLAPIEQLIGQLSDIKERNKNELDVISGQVDANDIEEKQIELNKQLNELDEQLQEKTKGMKTDVKDAERDFKEEIESSAKKCKDDMLHKIEYFEDIKELDSVSLQKQIESKLYRAGREAYGNYCDRIQEILAMCNTAITDELNDLQEGSFQIQLDKKLVLPEYSVGLEEYEKETERLKTEIKQAEEVAEKYENDLMMAMKADNDRKSLERKLESIKQARNFYEENSETCIPTVQRRVEQKEVITKRGGIGGAIAFILNGRKREWKEVEVLDHSERDDYLKRRDNRLKKYDDEIDQLDAEIQRCAVADSAAAQKAAERKARLLTERKNELQTYESNFAKKLKEENLIQIKKLKRNVEDYVDEMVDDFTKQCRTEFRKTRDIQINLMTDLIGRSIKKQIEGKQQELELLKRQLESAVSERNIRKTELESELADIMSILSNVLNIESAIRDIKEDVITEEAI